MFKFNISVEKRHITLIVFLNLIGIAFVWYILLESHIREYEWPSFFLYGRYLVILAITFLLSTIAGSIVEDKKRKREYILLSMLAFIIYSSFVVVSAFFTITILYPIKIILLLLNSVTILLGYFLSFLFNPYLVKKLKIKFIFNKRFNVLILVPCILVFIFMFPSFLYGVNPACIAYDNCVGCGIFSNAPIYSDSKRACFLPFGYVAEITKNEKYCNVLADEDRCYIHIAAEKDDPKTCIKKIFFDFSSPWDRKCIWQFIELEPTILKVENNSNAKIKLYNFDEDVCDVLLTDRKDISDEEKYTEYDECLKAIWDMRDLSWSIDIISICEKMNNEELKVSCLQDSKVEIKKKIEKEDETISLLYKYKDVLKDDISFQEELANPRDIDFCNLLSLLSIYRTIDNNYMLNYNFDSDLYKIICFANFGQNKEAEDLCSLSSGEDVNEYRLWKWHCQGGLHFYNRDREGEKEKLLSAFGFNQAGFAAASTSDPLFNLSSYMGMPLEGSSIGGYYITSYLTVRERVKALKPMSFCDNVKQYQAECKNIVET